ncbi:MAG TPA: aminoglycoside phosphotransferase family protein [Polyangiales bacterium]|nr:aminoglycoside phosphotransferase family protein [Polyangiales bacterium]
MGKQRPAEEVQTDAALARRLLVAEFPQWAALPLTRVIADSTDNDMYRLGDDMAVRLPRRASAVLPVDKEHEWLPRLAPLLPARVPLPLGKGEASEGYPHAWSVVRWIEGEPPAQQVNDPAFARDLAAFVKALHALDASVGPEPGAHNFWRGVPLSARDANMRKRCDWLADLPDIAAITAAWDSALTLPAWDRAPVWIHGDLQRGNLLIRDGRLAGVLDWSALGVGDPAGDLSVAWSLFGAAARTAYRAALNVDDDTWARGRAWALIEGVLALSYYRGKNDAIAEAGRRVIDVVLDEA